MAYMSQEHKKRIAVELKKVLPKDWRWTLAVKNHSAIVLNIWEGPGEIMINKDGEKSEKHRSPNEYYLLEGFQDERIGRFFVEVKKALDLDNFDKSDIMTDYFHVGHYVDINFGRWDKAYIVNPESSKPWESEPEPAEVGPEPEETADPIMAFVETLDFGDNEPEPAEVGPEPVKEPEKPDRWMGKYPDWYCPID